MLIRLDRLIAERGDFSRREAASLAREGRITVGGEVVADASRRVDDALPILISGEPLESERSICIMLNKPAGCVSATSDSKLPTVADLLPERYVQRGVTPAGRLDRDAEGFLLMTNDGQLNHRLTSPKYEIWKEYFVRVEGNPGPEAARRFAEGMDLGDFTSLPAEISLISQAEGVSECLVRVREGKFHQVKRMCEEVGCPVVYLKRMSIGGVALDSDLAPGQYRSLRADELTLLRTLTGLV